ncbi:hypothetical protein [Plebeiibacterium sediminum]|uniref:Uncharacterized protein n=1 Tax=Plebeiibacterium sediminum TaxID=2992112 RepID=A0AAE3M203_9BACT|nr:hypothetical protein [Plebeiobacterium sediminum]MCW3785345.1 hypothetical protein [Plebeiobacterium sediminum]
MSKMCKKDKKKDKDPQKQEEKKFRCKKCNQTSNKEKKLCKPVKND